MDGIDALFVGPFDLGNSIGHPIKGTFDPELEAAIARVMSAALANGKKAGIYCADGHLAAKYAGMGFQMVRVYRL